MIEDICKKIGVSPTQIALVPRIRNGLKRTYTFSDLIGLFLQHTSTKEVAKVIGTTEKVVWRATTKFNIYGSQIGYVTYKQAFLALINKKCCSLCQRVKVLSEFYRIQNDSAYDSRCKECKNQLFKEYYYANPDVVNQGSLKRAKKLDRKLTPEEIICIFERDGYKCKICGMTNEDHEIGYATRLHIDHILPISKGGKNTLENTQLLCLPCNSRKSNKT